MAEKAITVKYGDIEIEYEEQTNRWRFELRGRERFAESLTKAKEAIDKPEPVKKIPFERIEAYIEKGQWEDGKRFKTVTVTSVADATGRYGSTREVWILDGKERKKQDANKVFAVCKTNDILIADLKNLAAETDRIDKKIKKCREALVRISLPKEE